MKEREQTRRRGQGIEIEIEIDVDGDYDEIDERRGDDDDRYWNVSEGIPYTPGLPFEHCEEREEEGNDQREIL